MSPRPPQRRSSPEEASRLAAIADAHTAAETASRVATLSVERALRAGAGEDDASEVVRASLRAWNAAMEAEHAPTCDAAWAAARLAWTAVNAALAAESRVSAAIERQRIAA
jgi:hypothetical protein